MAQEIAVAAASEVVKEATSDTYGLLKQQISYVFKYQNYINNLKNQVQEIRYKREMVQRPVESAERRGEEIYELVAKWLSDVDEFTEGVAKSIIEHEDKANKGGCFKLGSCPNLIQRYRLGKKAMKAKMDGADLLGKGTFSCVSYLPALQRTESMYVRGYEAFDSRTQVLQEIMDTLKDANVNMIGVYGMGGVGKTTLVKKVAWQAKENKLFDEAVIAEVTQNPDYKKIQEKIASELGLEFRHEGEYERVGLLRNRIKKEKNLLIILDNIWTKLDLDAIGIPFEGAEKERKDEVAEKERKNDKIRRCTVLLTSRNLDVLCKDMMTQKNISVHPLSYGDAWNLFQKTLGDSAENPDFHDLAAQIVTKCAGLPLAISTIAYALKNESLHAWEDTLAQLKRSNPRCTVDMDETLYSTIELSYNFLKNEEAKTLFLLCALLNAGSSISIGDLLKYSMGWSLFGDGYTLEEGRNRLHRLIDHLKASCLLLADSEDDDRVKMHDIIHAVAVSIASTDKLMFNIQNVTGLKEVLEEKKDSNAISLPYRDIYDELPEKLECPKLKLFLLLMENQNLQIPDTFFEGMRELKVLDLTGIQFLSLPSSLYCLKNIRTLCLDWCQLRDVAIVGKLKTLVILSFLGSDIEQLPGEIRQLTRLKLLDLTNCLNLRYIAPNVISCLSELEELYMGNSSVQWEVEGLDNQGRKNASLGELKQLSYLKALHLHIQDARVMPRDLFFKKLKSYKIFIGDKWKWSGRYDLSTSRTLKLKINNSSYLSPGITNLLKMTEDLSLEEMNGVRNVLYELDMDGFPHLKHLLVKDGHELLCIIKLVACKLAFPMLESLILRSLIKLEKICHGQLNAGSFSKLRIMKVEKCDRLEYLFASLGAKNLTQLQEIEVTECKNLKGIFGEESKDHGYEIETNNKIEFNQLCSLMLQRLPQFIKIGSDIRVVFPRLENLKLCSINIENIWLDQPLAMSSYSRCLKSFTVEECNGLKFLFPIEAQTLKNIEEEILGFHNLKSLKVHNCGSLRYIFTPSIILGLDQLQEIEVKNCGLIEEIITQDKEKKAAIDKIIIPHLKSIVLELLPNLTNFYSGTNDLECPSLKTITITNCSKIETFVFTDLKEKDHFDHASPLFNEKVAFPSLEVMVLLHLDNLQLIWHNQQVHVESFCKLKEVRVEFCEKLKTIVLSNSHGLLTFHNLKKLTVENCWSMKSLFPVTIGIGLRELNHLCLYSCGLEKIFSEEEVNGAPRFYFPQLTLIHLSYLLELKCFYPGLHTTEWPMLKTLGVYGCKKIKIYASEISSFQMKDDGERQPALFPIEKVIPNLEELALDAHDFRLTFLHSDLAESFGKLKRLSLGNVDDESVASLFGFFQRLNCLELLFFCNNSFKELFPYEQGHMWKQDSQVDTFLQNLLILEVVRCHNLTILMPSAMSFKNLKILEACDCDGLVNVLTCSAAKTLVNLTTMRIRECKLVTEVIANEGDREEEIVFYQMKVLEVHRLSSLTFFCSANYSFKFPCLEQVIVSQCPRLKIFSQGLLSTPLLKRVQLTKKDDGIEYFWKEDLNSTIQKMFTDMIGFRNLEYLKLSEFPTLTEKIWTSRLPIGLFCNVKWLVVDDVFDTSSAFPSHELFDLKNLERLEVRNCHSLKDLFAIEAQTLNNNEEETLGFNNLKSLKVHNCGSLRYIFTPSIILGLHQLQEIDVRNCGLIDGIITKGEEKKAAVNKIIIPHLKSIVLELLPDLINFYSGTNDLECPSLKSITIANCSKMETFVFADLKEKDHSDYTSPLFSEKVAFPSLEVMVLSHLDKLQLIWHNQKLHVESFCKLKEVRVEFCQKLKTIVPSNSHGLLTFHNLEELTVENCWSMKSLFPVTIGTGLVQLNHLYLFSCGLEKLVSEEEVNWAPRFLFPQLTFIHLGNLPELKCFYPGLHTTEWPMLNSLGVHGCKKIKTYALEIPSFQKKDDGERQLALFPLEKVIQNLEELGLDAHDFKLTFLHSDLAESFGKLKRLVLVKFDDESVASLFGFLQRLNCLESLIFRGNSFKELFPYEQGHMWKQDSQVDTFLQNLQTLEVVRCHYLTILMPLTTSFKSLTTLEACNCDGLANALTCSAAKTLVNLTTMRIRECKLVTEVIANEGGREEEIVFDQMKVLELHCLSSLTFFCSANYSFKFPCLEQVIVSQCPRLMIFSQGLLSTPLLKRVQLTKKDGIEYFWMEDLNSTIQKMFTDMIGFRNLEYLKLSEFPTFREKIWTGQLPIGLFCKVKWLVLDKVFDTSSAFPSHVLHDLKNLERLEVRNCQSLKDLFAIEAQTLKNNEEETLGFNNLKSLKVHNCGSLRYIFTPSIILGLHQLQEIEVRNCGSIDGIITKGEEKKAAVNKIIIPHLKSIVLELLPDLINFYSGTNDLECPSLKSITIANCSKMETFVFADLKEKDHSDYTSPLFSEKVAFPRLEVMVLSHLDNLQLIWYNRQLHVESFCKLKEVRVEFCEKLKTIVPSNSHGLLTLHNLKELTVKNCWSLKSLFPVSIAIGLVQLNDLCLVSCGLEKIVFEEEVNGAPRFLFPHLTDFYLHDLPKLKCFYPGLHTTEWPMLNSLGVYDCKKIKIYASEISSFQKKDDEERQPVLFPLEKVIPNLEDLGLDAHDFRLTFLHSDLAESFGKLKRLWLSYFDDESVASLFGFLQRLNCLELLGFCDNNFKELFPSKQGHIRKQDSQVDTFLQNLQTLEVKDCHYLTILMPSAMSFKNLKILEACDCDGLVNVLAYSAAKTLVNLTTMRIRECKLVTEVIANEGDKEDDIVFGQMKVLELYCLSSLTFFCSANYSFKFPCLEQVIVSQCPKLKIFSQGVLSTPLLRRVQLTEEDDDIKYFWKEDLNSTVQKMFTDMVGFRNFEHLTLSQFPNMKEKIWNGQVPIDLFWNLKHLVVDKFSNMLSAIPFNVLCRFKNLEMLDVRSCESLEQVFDLQGVNANGLALEENRQEILGLKKLKSLKIGNCNSLRYIFTPSILLGLVQLQEIEVKNCALIEEVIKKEAQKDAMGDKIIISQLNSVTLESLPNLTSFYLGSDILECPPLKTIIIKDCQKIHMKEFSIHLASLFNVKVVLPNLEASSCFQNLTILVIDDFNHLKYLFPSSMVKSLFRLKELEISNCKFMERVIDEEEERSSTMLFPKLYQLKLRVLPKLTTFCNSTANFVEMPSLFKLCIDNCSGMQTFISSSICGDMMLSSKEHEETNAKENFTKMQFLFDTKVRLPSLERLQISYADELVKIWDDHVSLDSFCKLNHVSVYFCKRLASVFPSNMLGGHHKLEILEVQNCDSIAEIFEVLEKRCSEMEEIVDKEEAIPRFVFSKLTTLSLQMLPSLKSLYPKIHISKWPVLDVLKVYECDNVEIFASEFFSIRETHEESQQRPLFLVYKDAFPSLEELELCKMPKLLHLWRGNSQTSKAFQNLKTLKVSECCSLENSWASSVSFQNLATLQVSRCGGLRYLLTPLKARSLDRLTRMNVSDCKMMKEIITQLGDEVLQDPIVFNRLDCLELHCLSSLKSFCCGDYTLEFPTLKKVLVRQCLKMETFCHGVLRTPKLDKLQLTEGENEVEECWEGNLNSTIQHLFKKNMNVQSSKED